MVRTTSIGQLTLIALMAFSLSGLASGCGAGADETDELHEKPGTIPQGLSWCLGGTNGDADYCKPPCAPCGLGQGDCDSDAECQSGLVCKTSVGPKFGLGITVDVCVPPDCGNGIWDANECGIDCGGTSACGTCLIQISSKTCGGEKGGNDYCRNPNHPCTEGEGPCHNNTELCAAGLVCKRSAGALFGLPRTTDVCVTASCANGLWDADECGMDCGGTSVCGPCANPKATKTCGGNNGGFDYCRNPNHRCTEGEGDCHNDNALCATGLVCKVAAGAQFGLPRNIDICVGSASCTNRTWDANECGVDCGGTSGCGACVISQATKSCGGSNGGFDYCRNPNHPCTEGEGDCHNNSALCAPGLVCRVAAGAQFGLPSNIDVCVPDPCAVNPNACPQDAGAPDSSAPDSSDGGAPDSSTGDGAASCPALASLPSGAFRLALTTTENTCIKRGEFDDCHTRQIHETQFLTIGEPTPETNPNWLSAPATLSSLLSSPFPPEEAFVLSWHRTSDPVITMTTDDICPFHDPFVSEPGYISFNLDQRTGQITDFRRFCDENFPTFRTRTTSSGSGVLICDSNTPDASD